MRESFGFATLAMRRDQPIPEPSSVRNIPNANLSKVTCNQTLSPVPNRYLGTDGIIAAEILTPIQALHQHQRTFHAFINFPDIDGLGGLRQTKPSMATGMGCDDAR